MLEMNVAGAPAFRWSLLLLAVGISAARAEILPSGLALTAGLPRSSHAPPAADSRLSPSPGPTDLPVETVLGGLEIPTSDPNPLEDHDFQLLELPAKIRDDLRALVLAPVDWRGREWRRFGVGVGLVLAASALDDPIHALVDRGHSRDVDRVATRLRPLGQEAGVALFAGAWMVGRASGRPEWVALGQDGLEASLIASVLMVPTMKSLSGRSRPRESHSVEGRPALFGDGQSFPSGEAAQAFALASVLASHARSRPARVVAYVAAGLLAAHRIVVDAHWTSDVVAGALVGSAIGKFVFRRRGERPDSVGERRIRSWAVGPSLAPTRGGYGISLRLTF